MDESDLNNAQTETTIETVLSLGKITLAISGQFERMIRPSNSSLEVGDTVFTLRNFGYVTPTTARKTVQSVRAQIGTQMSIIKNTKNAIGTPAHLVARLYIRHSPFHFLKQFLWENCNWRNRSYLVKTQHGIRMKGNSLDTVQGYIYYFGIWEPNLTAFIDRRLRGLSGRTFVDVGANVGYFSLLAARQMNHGKVVAVEAFPSIFEKLLENVKLNGVTNIRTVAKAATESRRQVSMYHGGQHNEGSTTSISGVFASEPIIVEGLPLSEILTEDEIRTVRLIKIDVEGAEYAVIQGMDSMITKLPNDVEFVVEITPSALGGEHLHKLLNTFEQAGFFPYLLHNFYDPKYYMFSQEICLPSRMKLVPTLTTDIVFSRIDADHL